MSFRNLNVLLVEDEVLIAMMEKKQLEEWGYEVYHVVSGEKSVKAIADGEIPFDLVLMDIDLGRGMDGTEAAVQILEQRDIPIVFLSSHTEPEVVKKTENITSYGYVVKNSGMVVLDASIKMAMRLFDARMERRELEHALKEQYDFSETIIETSQAIILVLDSEGRIIRFNSYMEELTGWLLDDVRGKDWFELCVKADDVSLIKPYFMKRANHVKTTNIVGCIIAKDGHEVIVEWYNKIMKSKDGKVAGVLAVGLNITEQRMAENAIRERSQFIETLLNLSPDNIYIYDLDNKKNVYSNDGILKTLGYSIQELQAMGNNMIQKLMHPEDFEHYINNTLPRYAAAKDDQLIVHQFRLKHKSGEWLWLSASELVYSRFSDGSPKEIFGIIHDISEYVKSEEALKSIQWYLRKKSDISKQYDPPYDDLTRFNTSGLILHSVGKEILRDTANNVIELLGTSLAIYEKNGDYALGIFSSGWCQLLDRASYKLCHTDDSIKALNSGKWLCHESCWSNASKSCIETGTPVDIVCHGGIHLYAVPVFARKQVIGTMNLGYGEPPTKSSELKKIADKYQINFDDLREHARSYKSRPGFIIENAKKRLLVSAKLIGEIVERKLIEKDYLASEEKFENLFKISPDAMAISRLSDNVFIAVNDRFSEILGYTREEAMGHSPVPGDLGIWINGADREKWLSNLENNPAILPTEIDFRSKDGVIRKGHISGRLIEFSGDKCLLTVLRDITDLKGIEETLRKRTTALDKRIKELDCLYGIAELTNRHDLSLDEILQGIVELIPSAYQKPEISCARILYKDKSYVTDNFKETLLTQRSDFMVNRSRAGLVEVFCLQDFGLSSGGPFLPEELRLIKGISDRVQRIIERRLAEEELAQQLKEKEILLREVHHRVKNNIASIEGFLNLKAMTSDNSQVKASLHDAVSLVQNMRVLYERILIGNGFQDVSMKLYIEQLIPSVKALFPESEKIFFEVKIDDFSLPEKQASSVGIIINELLTNILKYAFKDREQGKVSIFLKKKDRLVSLVLQDDGVGIDEQLLMNDSPGFGITIIKMLADQLKGHFTIENNKGTISHVFFEI